MNRPPQELTLAEIVRRIDKMERDLAAQIRAAGDKHAAEVYAAGELAPIAVSASEVARMLSVRRDVVYQLHREGVLNGFRPRPKSHLKFLVSEVRSLAQRWSEERRDA